jgi:hypothetical protein
MNVPSTQFFPPLADPVLWQSFRDNRPPGLKRGRDGWNRDEMDGDRMLAAIATSLFQRYGIPHSWCHGLVNVLLSNAYFRKISELQNLSKHLFQIYGKKIDADAFEV